MERNGLEKIQQKCHFSKYSPQLKKVRTSKQFNHEKIFDLPAAFGGIVKIFDVP